MAARLYSLVGTVVSEVALITHNPFDFRFSVRGGDQIFGDILNACVIAVRRGNVGIVFSGGPDRRKIKFPVRSRESIHIAANGSVIGKPPERYKRKNQKDKSCRRANQTYH